MKNAENVLRNVEEQKAPVEEAKVEKTTVPETTQVPADSTKNTVEDVEKVSTSDTATVAPQEETKLPEKVENKQAVQNNNQNYNKNNKKDTQRNSIPTPPPVVNTPTPSATPYKPDVIKEESDLVLKRGTYSILVGSPQRDQYGCDNLINTIKTRVGISGDIRSIPNNGWKSAVIVNITDITTANSIKKKVLTKGLKAQVVATETIYNMAMV